MSARIRAERWLARISVRERLLVALALAGASLALWDGLVLRPLAARAAERRDERALLEQSLARAATQREALLAALAHDPGAERRARLAELEARRDQVDAEIRDACAGLIAPAQMTRVLRSILSARPALRLMRLEGAPAQPLLESEGNSSQEVGPGLQPIYRHALRVEIEASFSETLAFLRAVEALPWKLFWDELRYEVGAYPIGRVSLVVHTLGDREGWVGA